MEIEVSVVVQMYNAGPYLEPCLKSLCTQNFDSYEILIIDDASTDGSRDIAEKFATSVEKCKVFFHRFRMGAARSRNDGLALAHGHFVMFLDADDRYELNYISSMYHKIVRYNADVCHCNRIMHDMKTGETWEQKVLSDTWKKKLMRTFNWHDLGRYTFLLFNVAPGTKMINRKMLIETGLSFQNLENSNDVFWGDMLLVVSKCMVYIPHAYVHKHVNWGGNIGATRGQRPMCAFFAHKKLHDELKKMHLPEMIWKSYSEWTIHNLLFALQCSDWNDSFFDFLRTQGLSELEVGDMHQSDFSNPILWKEYCKLQCT